MPSEERVMRAREVLAGAFDKLPHGRARAESFRTPAFTTDDDQVILAAMLTFADEGSGIGVLDRAKVQAIIRSVVEGTEHVSGATDRIVALAASISSREAE